MEITNWIDVASASAVLDVGCNVGALLQSMRGEKPSLRIAGVEVNEEAIVEARARLPGAELHHCGAEVLPFVDAQFDIITCIEVLEHVPARLRRQVLSEIRRVLKPTGSVVLQVPHAGAFAWLDPSNARFRFPYLYGKFVGKGLREAGMRDVEDGVVWHHHFSSREIEDLTKGLFEIERIRGGGLFVLPICDIACWPFYRARKYDGALFNFLQRAASWDLHRDYGWLSYDIRYLLRAAISV
jgi:SAM-dependent methyltransferase